MKNNQSIEKTGARWKRSIGGMVGISLCCAMIVGLSVNTGRGIYAYGMPQDDTVQVAQENADVHEQRMLARTMDGDTSADEWEWEVSESSVLAENNLP